MFVFAGSSESGRKWWQVFSPDSSEADLQHIARQIMAFYEDSRSPSKMDQPGKSSYPLRLLLTGVPLYIYMYIQNIVVAVHSQDSMRLACANAVLAVHYNYFGGSS